jgi:SAM-dependent methyltransferase
MKISNLLQFIQKPGLYEPGNAFMWTDPHISKQLLKVHLSNETDLASRKPGTILTTIDWILSHCKGEKLHILDLGCGPGLYAEQLAEKGHEVTGIDISQNSIEYAKSQAKIKNLDIHYLCKDYTKLDFTEHQFDLVVLIYTDFCPLLPNQRENLLKGIKKVLKPGGIFIFDFSNDNDLNNKTSPNNWEMADKGFWSCEPYLVLSNSFLYAQEKIILYQHLVCGDDGAIDLYRFWHHFFSRSDIINILGKFEFTEITFYNGVIPGGDGYRSEDVTFCTAC